jgi:hypothetical protein
LKSRRSSPSCRPRGLHCGAVAPTLGSSAGDVGQAGYSGGRTAPRTGPGSPDPAEEFGQSQGQGVGEPRRRKDGSVGAPGGVSWGPVRRRERVPFRLTGPPSAESPVNCRSAPEALRRRTQPGGVPNANGGRHVELLRQRLPLPLEMGVGSRGDARTSSTRPRQRPAGRIIRCTRRRTQARLTGGAIRPYPSCRQRATCELRFFGEPGRTPATVSSLFAGDSVQADAPQKPTNP